MGKDPMLLNEITQSIIKFELKGEFHFIVIFFQVNSDL